LPQLLWLRSGSASYWRWRLAITWAQRLRNLANSVIFLTVADTPQVLNALRPRLNMQMDGSFSVFVKISLSWACTVLLASLNHSLPFKSQLLMSAVHAFFYERHGLQHHLNAISGWPALQAGRQLQGCRGTGAPQCPASPGSQPVPPARLRGPT
jgi:hypothetical protein